MPEFRNAMRKSVLFAVRGPIVLASLVFAAEGARGAEFEFSSHTELKEAFSDNIDRVHDNQRADFFTTVDSGVAVHGSGARFEFDLDYSLERLFFLENSEKNIGSENILGSGRVELVEDAIFLDAEASFRSQDELGSRIDPRTGQPFVLGDSDIERTDDLRQQPLSTQGAAFAREVIATEDSTSTRTFSVTPSIRHHFGTWADAEARYTVGSVSSDTSASASDTGAPASDTGTSDTTTNRLLATVNSGRRFSTLNWGLTFDLTSTDQSDGAGSTEYRLVQAELEYAIDPQFSLLASIGHEREEDVNLAGLSDEILWSVGIHARGARTDLRATYGERLMEKNLSLDVNYEIGLLTILTASYLRDIQTSEALFRSDLNFIDRDPFGQLIDTRTGLPFVFSDSPLGLPDDTTKTQRFDAAITRTTDRNTIRLDAFQELQESDSVGAKQQTFRTSIVWNRRFNRNSNGNLDLSYQRTDSGTGQVDNLIRVISDIEYRIAKNITGSILYDHAIRYSDQVDNLIRIETGLEFRFTEDITGSILYDRTMRFSDDAQSDFTENVIAARIRGNF